MLRVSTIATAVLMSVSLSVATVRGAEKVQGLDKQGKADLKSAGPIAFGPPGVLFVGDSQGASLFAIGVDPGTPAKPAPFKVEGLDAKLAGLLGTKAADILINDVAVQPVTGIAYISASRGRGPDAQAVLATVTAAGKLDLVNLDNVAYAQVTLANAPTPEQKDGRGNSLRQDSITDLHFVEGRVFVAGLSNEGFPSTLRAIEFPFSGPNPGTGVEIYHGAHGAFETKAPVRTFVPFNIGGEPHILAAYQCTPLVTIPVAQLQAGGKVKGRTVAELGNRNRPLDIIAYEKEGRAFLLLANSARGVMKITTDNIDKQEGIEQRVADKAGLPYETIADLKGVEHLDKVGNEFALLLVRTPAGLNLETVPLP
ncbi:MAG: hypothetical protein JSS02_20860 [Planctomycetes bacterium]|nr:hypothetical protein [Planctomycetota bacterium]